MRTLIFVALLAAAHGMAAEPTPQSRLAMQALQDLGRVCQTEGILLWGKSLCGRVVLVDPSTNAAIANQPDPDGKFRKEGDVFVGDFPEQFTPANTSIQWGGEEWATVMLPLPTDPFQRLRLLAHESFHRIQSSLGLSASDAPNACLDTEAGRLWLRMELRALARAMREQGAPARRSAADAMLFAAYRHHLCGDSAAMEAAMEKQEGLAEYTGVVVALRATGEDISREARSVEAFEDSNAYARSFAYVTGPALGLLLDRYAPGWRKRAASASLDSMLISALHVRFPADLERQAQLRGAVYGYSAVAAAEREREQRHQALLAELKSRFLEGAILEFPSAPEMSRNFNPSTLVPFPPHGVYYPTGVFAANWGKLEVESGGALVAPDNRSLKVPAPVDPDAKPIRGAGWVLHLAPGWKIQPAGHAGSFVVSSKP